MLKWQFIIESRIYKKMRNLLLISEFELHAPPKNDIIFCVGFVDGDK